MRMKRILSGLLVVVMVLSMMTMNVFAADSSSKVVLSDVPFDYGVVPFSEEWDELTTLERKTIFSIPKKVAESLTTEALLESILSNPYIIDLFAYDDFALAVKLRDNQFQIKEFLSRSDSYSVLSEYSCNYSKSIKTREVFIGSELNNISDIKNSKELRNFVFDSLELCFIESIENNILSIFDISNDVVIETRGYTGEVYTKRGTEVDCVFNKTWDDWVAEDGITASETFAITKMAGYRVLYSGLTQVAGIDPSYNCHSFAWHAPTVNNNVWIEDTFAYRTESIPLESWDSDIAVGTTKVMHYGYFDDSSAPSHYHSSRVYELNSNGSIKTVISKWGTLALLIHDIDECPYSTGSHTLLYFNY